MNTEDLSAGLSWAGFGGEDFGLRGEVRAFGLSWGGGRDSGFRGKRFGLLWVKIWLSWGGHGEGFAFSWKDLGFSWKKDCFRGTRFGQSLGPEPKIKDLELKTWLKALRVLLA